MFNPNTNLLTALKDVFELMETAVHNANDSQNRVSAVEPKITEIEGLSDTLYEIEADQEFRICCLEMGMSPDDFEENA